MWTRLSNQTLWNVHLAWIAPFACGLASIITAICLFRLPRISDKLGALAAIALVGFWPTMLAIYWWCTFAWVAINDWIFLDLSHQIHTASLFWTRISRNRRHLDLMPHRLSLCVVFALLLSLSCLGDDWIPPKNPKPSEILKEARADTKAKRYSEALAKHVWFHENALKYEPAVDAVRLSLALSDWVKLGKVYPPALEKLIAIRDQIKSRAQNGEDIGRAFEDLANINEYLGDYTNTVECFMSIEKNHPDSAPLALLFAKKAILKTKEYQIYAKYITGTTDFLAFKETYELSKSTSNQRDNTKKHHLEYVEKTFRHETLTLVAVLVNVGRKQEANEIAELARAMIDDKKFHMTLDAALKGIVPDPWP
jgi:hypothetical protein